MIIHDEFGSVKQGDVTRCESGPTSTSNDIQPYGILFVLKEPELTILQVSNNTQAILGMSPQALLNKNLDTIIEGSQLTHLKGFLWEEDLRFIDPVKFQVKVREQEYINFDGIVHRTEAGLILELEPSMNEWTSFSHLYQLMQLTVAKLQHASSLLQLLEITAEEVRTITGFDRVIISQLDKDWDGEVVAEAKLEGLSSYLGLHFPASDFPELVRELSHLTCLRYIVDVNFRPATILPATHPETGRSLDLRFAVLRDASPLYSNYLRNLGVAASISFPLLKEGHHWGLITGLHQSPKRVPYEIRTRCEFIGQMASLLLTTREDHAYETNVQSELATVQQINRQLEQKNQELETSAYSLIHDLSMPLSIITRFAELLSLENHATRNPQDQAYIENILDAAAQMKMIISNLPEYLLVGHQAVSHEPIALHELLIHVAKGLQFLLDETQGQISLPEDLPIIEGNPALLSQIFMNLFRNALTYRRPGITPEIRVTCKVEPHTVLIGVADNGIGIAAQDYDKIFTIFQRLKNNEPYPGTGIGLAAVKKTVALMNGQVWVESVVGEGSTFWVKLPLLTHR